MSKIATVGLDLAKSLFQAAWCWGSGHVLFRKKLRRDQVLSLLRQLDGATKLVAQV